MKFLNFVVCDDIRQELHGKMTLVGMYNGFTINILTPNTVDLSKPAVIPSLCLFISAIVEKDDPVPAYYKLEMHLKERKLQDLSGKINYKDNKSVIGIGIKMSPFVVHDEGEIITNFSVLDANNVVIKQFNLNKNIRVNLSEQKS